MKKKAFLYAYDKVNLGDDLFIRTIVTRYPHVHFYMWSDARNRMNFSDLKNLTVIDKNATRFKIISKIRSSLVVRYQENLKKKCDAVIYIGGSIFMEYPTWKNIVNWWTYQAEHHKFYVLGANFGPYQTEEYRLAMDEVFSKLQDVCFRDQYSYDLFKDNEKVRIAPDILFSLGSGKREKKEKKVLISAIHCKKKDEGKSKLSSFYKTYINFMAKLSKLYLENGYSVVYTSFCEDEGDGDAIKDIIEFLEDVPETKYRVVVYTGLNTQEILREIGEAECIVASRFHAAVLGMAYGTNVLPIIYSDKTLHVLNDLEYKGKIIDIRHLEEYDTVVLRDLLGTPLKQSKVNIMALKHFMKLDEIFEIES